MTRLRDKSGRVYNCVVVSLLVLLLVVVACPPAWTQDRSTPEAHELARLILSSGTFEAVMTQAGSAATIVVIAAVEGRLRRSLSADERSELRTLLTQVTKDTLPWDLWEALYAGLYSKYASPAEITELLAFYKTPLGRRALSLNVILTTAGAEAGRNLAKSREQEFQTRFMDALAKTMPGLKAELERSGQSR